MSGQVALMLARQRMLKVALRVIGNEIGEGDTGYAESAMEAEYAYEQLSLAARELTRATDALRTEQQPVGWIE